MSLPPNSDDPKANIEPELDLDEEDEEASLPALEEDAAEGAVAGGVAAIIRMMRAVWPAMRA